MRHSQFSFIIAMMFVADGAHDVVKVLLCIYWTISAVVESHKEQQ